MADPFEHASFLSRSKTRVQLLSRLSDAGPATQRDLRDDLDTSQSTVVRSIQALEERGWVESDGGTVHLTGAGRFVGDAFCDLLETLAEADELGPFLRWFPCDEFDLDLTQLCGASVTTPKAGDPYAPGREQTDLVRTASEVRVVLPSIDLDGTRVVHERITDGDLEAEVVVDPGVGETIRAGEYAQFFREQLRTGRLSVYCYGEPVPLYLGVDEGDRVQIGVEDADGIPQALLETDNAPVRTWAEGVFREYRDRATELDADDFA